MHQPPRNQSPTPIEIRLLPTDASVDSTVMHRIVDLINEVYRDAEKGMWTADTTRTTLHEISEMTRTGQIAVASLRDLIVGCVRVHRLDERTGEFGMLASDPAYRGIGVGRELVHFAEQNAREEGIRSMQLELLVPREWSHPAKEFLAAWYTRTGYRTVRTGSIDEAYPNLAPFLATPCDFVIYQKDLRLGTPSSSP